MVYQKVLEMKSIKTQFERIMRIFQRLIMDLLDFETYLPTIMECIAIYTEQLESENRMGQVFSLNNEATYIQCCAITDKAIRIITDIKAATRTLQSVLITLKFTLECPISLEEIERHSQITLMWVQAYNRKFQSQEHN